MANTLAIDIGGTKFTIALFTDGEMRQRVSTATDREGGRDWMLARIEETVRSWNVRLDDCGIGFGGPVDFYNQRVYLSTHVGGWENTDLIGWVRRTFGIPAVMDNDANVGALGEGTYGAGQGHDPLFYMTLSTGIGGGIVNKGRVLRGADSYAGEIGHITIRPGGKPCLCGSAGCFERHCCGLWLERDHGRSARDLLADPEFVRTYVVDLALGLKACLMLLNPSRIVIGGGMSKAGDALFLPLRQELGRQMTAWSRARIDVVPATLGDDSVLWGALALTQEGVSR